MMSREEETDAKVTPADPLTLALATSKEKLAKKSSCITRFSGIFYSLTASFLFASATFTIKLLGVDLLDAFICRFLLQTLITASFALYKNYTLLGGTMRQMGLQIICAATGAIGFLLFSVALRYIELSDANTMGYTRVVWTVALSAIVYRERPSVSTLLALPLTLLGVVFVTQPSFLFTSENASTKNVDNAYRLVGFALALSCALISAINVLLFKQLISTSQDIKPSVLNFQFSFAMFFSLLLNQFYKIFYLQTTTSLAYLLTWRYLLSSAICLVTIAGGILTQKAIKREHPAVFSLLGSAEIIYALILQNIFTPVRSNIYALFGSALVISSVVLLGIARIINERNAQKKTRKEYEKVKNIEKC